jgi:hypothetical protein
MAKVDRNALDQALRRISEETRSAITTSINAAIADASSKGRLGSNAHSVMMVVAGARAYARGVAEMAQKVRDYAGDAAPQYAQVLHDEATRLLQRLELEHQSRLTAIGGKYPSMLQRQAIYMGRFSATLMNARDAETSDLQHKLLDSKATLPFLQQHWKAVVAWLCALVALILGAYLLRLLGLSQ